MRLTRTCFFSCLFFRTSNCEICYNPFLSPNQIYSLKFNKRDDPSSWLTLGIIWWKFGHSFGTLSVEVFWGNWFKLDECVNLGWLLKFGLVNRFMYFIVLGLILRCHELEILVRLFEINGLSPLTSDNFAWTIYVWFNKIVNCFSLRNLLLELF